MMQTPGQQTSSLYSAHGVRHTFPFILPNPGKTNANGSKKRSTLQSIWFPNHENQNKIDRTHRRQCLGNEASRSLLLYHSTVVMRSQWNSKNLTLASRRTKFLINEEMLMWLLVYKWSVHQSLTHSFGMSSFERGVRRSSRATSLHV